MSQHTEEEYRSRARDQYYGVNELEIDKHATVSMGDDDGAWVAAWVWVSDDGVKP